MSDVVLSGKRKEILEFIQAQLTERGYPPSVREIGEAVGLTSTSTVHSHLATLQKYGLLKRDATKPRAIAMQKVEGAVEVSPSRIVPLVGEVAAGVNVLAQQNIEESMTIPKDFTGEGEVFMLRVRGESMIDAGIFSGDYLVVRRQQNANKGDMVVAGIPGEEATVKYFGKLQNKIVLTPANATMEPMTFLPEEVEIFGKVISVMRRI